MYSCETGHRWVRIVIIHNRLSIAYKLKPILLTDIYAIVLIFFSAGHVQRSVLRRAIYMKILVYATIARLPASRVGDQRSPRIAPVVSGATT